jgi:hypothetical protein
MTFKKGHVPHGRATGRPNLPDAQRRKVRQFCISLDDWNFILDYGPGNPGRNLSVLVRVGRALKDAALRQHSESAIERVKALEDATRIHELQGLPSPKLPTHTEWVTEEQMCPHGVNLFATQCMECCKSC